MECIDGGSLITPLHRRITAVIYECLNIFILGVAIVLDILQLQICYYSSVKAPQPSESHRLPSFAALVLCVWSYSTWDFGVSLR